jgi:hypothetical protein
MHLFPPSDRRALFGYLAAILMEQAGWHKTGEARAIGRKVDLRHTAQTTTGVVYRKDPATKARGAEKQLKQD